MPIVIPLPKHFDKFLIRDWTMEDALPLADIEFDPEVKQFVGQTTGSKKDFVAQFQPDTVRGWAIAIHPENTVAGTIDMNKFELNPKKRELRILLAKEYRAQGIASEAARFFISCIFGASWVEGIVGVVHPENLASISLLKKLGFVHTGAIAPDRQTYEFARS